LCRQQTKLEDATSEKEDIEKDLDGESDSDRELLPPLERKIYLLQNEVKILKFTIEIYGLTYNKPVKTDLEKQTLVNLWEDLEQTFQTDKMKKILDDLRAQLAPAHKQKRI
jgi:hypothetical protein